jgi:hypothetical protein
MALEAAAVANKAAAAANNHQQHLQQQQQQQSFLKSNPPPSYTPMPYLTLSQLPEPPISVTEIGVIPPPAMFSSNQNSNLPDIDGEDERGEGRSRESGGGDSVETAQPINLSDFIYEGNWIINVVSMF